MVAQQLPQGTLWFFDQNTFNPALLTAENQHVVSANIRSQWSGFDGAPQTQRLQYVGQFSSQGYFGAGLMNDEAGAFARRGINLSYTHVIPVDENLKVRAGIRAGILQSAYDESQVLFLDEDDPEANGQSITSVNPAITPGVSVDYSGWNFGIAVPYALESNFSISNSTLDSDNKWRRHFQTSVSRPLVVNEAFTLEPSLWITTASGADAQWSLNMNAMIKDQFMIGGAYRNNSDIAMVIGARLKNIRFVYGYDLVSSGISQAATGSHEIGAMFTMNSKFADTDGDGVADTDDECPDQFGKVNGCPDSDMDGVIDKNDQCPDVAGLSQFAGCPDTDGDGIPDKLDKCPELAGLSQFEGCPDTDGDGIPDHLDSCPKTPATDNSDDGCPILTEEQKQVIEEAFGNLEFETGKAKIKEASFAFLIKLAMLLKENPTWQVDLAGHTDNVGSEELNMTLSKDRVEAVVNFLVNVEVPRDRMVVSHFGESKPIDSNDNEEGRARNRRVEMKFIFE